MCSSDIYWLCCDCNRLSVFGLFSHHLVDNYCLLITKLIEMKVDWLFYVNR